MKLSYLCLLFGLLSPVLTLAQKSLPQLPQPQTAMFMDQIGSDDNIDASATLKLIASYNNYPRLTKLGCNYVFYYNDNTLGKIPLRVYVPSTYENTHKTPCVLQLHGAVSQSRFRHIDSLADSDEGILTDPLKASNYIIIQPLADVPKGFTWGGNKWTASIPKPYKFNFTYQRLAGIVVALKQVLNIDDNRVYAFGHSDGADGAIGLAVYKPDQFAAIIAYNTMFTNLFAHDYYIRNIQNRPLYEVHSDKDALRRIGVNRQIIDSIKKFDNRITYKEYYGYEHWDKHLSIDAPNADRFMKSNVRDPFQNHIFFETTQGSPYTSCDWLSITKVDTSRKSAEWYHDFEVPARYQVQNSGTWYTSLYYQSLKSGVVKADYKDNVFVLQTSCVAEVTLNISSQMVDITKPVKVILNNKEVFNRIINADKSFVIKSFKHNFDRQALWVNAVKLSVD